MFDIGFWELALAAVVGLIVLGPEELPVVARFVGRLYARAARLLSELRNDWQQAKD